MGTPTSAAASSYGNSKASPPPPAVQARTRFVKHSTMHVLVFSLSKIRESKASETCADLGS